MTLRKIRALIAACVLGMFFISSFFVYLLSADIEDKLFDRRTTMQHNELVNNIECCADEEEILEYLRSGTWAFSFPEEYMLTDETGKTLFRTAPQLTVYMNSPFRKINIDLAKYITPDIQEQLDDFFFSIRKKSYIPVCDSVTLAKDGNEWGPVELTLVYPNYRHPEKKAEQRLTLTFSDREAEYYYDNGSQSPFSVEISHLDGMYYRATKSYKRCRGGLESAADLFAADFLESHRAGNEEMHRLLNVSYDSDWESNDESVYKGTFISERHFTVNGKKYCFLYMAKTDAFYDTLRSEQFKGAIGGIGILYLVFALVIYFVAVWLYKRSEKLKNSRAAFVSAAAHELKTPLAVISNNCECVLENVAPEKNAEYVSAIYDESRRMSRMVKTLLHYNGLNSAGKLKKEPTEMAGIVSDVSAKYLPLIEAKNVTFVRDVPEGIRLNCSAEEIGIAIDNFLSNAVKYTPANGKIRLTVTEKRGKLRWELFNSGSEISAADAPHIWEELYRGDPSRSHKEDSTGMGLAVCRLILERHGFDYGFENSADGVTFFFSER